MARRSERDVLIIVVLGVVWLTLLNHRDEEVVTYKLFVGQLPVAKSKEKEWREHQNGHSLIVQFLIVSWEVFIIIVQHIIFHVVEDYETKCRNWEEDRHASTKHHSDKYNIQDARIFGMKLVPWLILEEPVSLFLQLVVLVFFTAKTLISE